MLGGVCVRRRRRLWMRGRGLVHECSIFHDTMFAGSLVWSWFAVLVTRWLLFPFLDSI
jgi:hypothetical protein